MKKSEYFQEISDFVRLQRVKKQDLSEKELAVYRLGKRDAHLEVLREFHNKKAYEIFENTTYSVEELFRAIKMDISFYKEKLDKARAIYRAHIKIIDTLRQNNLFEGGKNADN